MNPVDVDTWNGKWAWSLPLIVLNVVIHVFGLVFINEKVVPVLSGAMEHRRFVSMFAVIMGVAALLATLLHALEAGAWKAAESGSAVHLLSKIPSFTSRISNTSPPKG